MQIKTIKKNSQGDKYKVKVLNIQKLNRNISQTLLKELESNKIGGAEIIVNQNGEKIFHEVFGEE